MTKADNRAAREESPMPKFRKKPVVIEARRFSGDVNRDEFNAARKERRPFRSLRDWQRERGI